MNAQTKTTPAEPQIIASLAHALSLAQAEFPPIVKDKTAKVRMKAGGEYTYQYSDLADVIEAVKGPCAKYGLSHSQRPMMRDGSMVLLTKLLHTSGQFEECEWPLPNGGSPQEMGSALTYARRYSLCAILGVAAEQDDDGQAGQETKASAPPKQQTTQQRQEPPKQNGDPRPFALITGDGEELTFARGAEYLKAVETEFQAAIDKAGFWDSNQKIFEGWHQKLVKVGNRQADAAEFARVGQEIAETVLLLKTTSAG